MGERKGIPTGPYNRLRRSRRWTALKRETYLAVLTATGNARAAAEAIGMDRTTIEHRRAKDPGFDRDCKAALAEADRRLKGEAADAAARGEAPAGPDPFEVIRRAPGGRAQIAAAGKGRWNGRAETIFLAELRRTGNFSASARAAGFTLSTVLDRRRKWPAFARRIEEALDDAELVLEFRLASIGNDVAEEEAGCGEPPAERRDEFDREFALRFLKWREEKRRGGGGERRGNLHRWRHEPTIEEVRDDVERRLAALRRHREKYGGGEEGQPSEGEDRE